MSTTILISRAGALAVALGVGFAVATGSGPAFAAISDSSPSDLTALLIGGTTTPTLHDDDIALLMDQFIAPTHPGQSITPVGVTTPEEALARCERRGPREAQARRTVPGRNHSSQYRLRVGR